MKIRIDFLSLLQDHSPRKRWCDTGGTAEPMVATQLCHILLWWLQELPPQLLSCPICSSPLPQQKEKLSPQPLQFRAWCFNINLPFWLCRTNVLTQEPWWWFNTSVCFTSQSWRCSQQQRQIYFFLRKAVPRPWYLLKLPGEVTHYYFLTWLLINLRIISQLH